MPVEREQNHDEQTDVNGQPSGQNQPGGGGGAASGQQRQERQQQQQSPQPVLYQAPAAPGNAVAQQQEAALATQGDASTREQNNSAAVPAAQQQIPLADLNTEELIKVLRAENASSISVEKLLRKGACNGHKFFEQHFISAVATSPGIMVRCSIQQSEVRMLINVRDKLLKEEDRQRQQRPVGKPPTNFKAASP